MTKKILSLLILILFSTSLKTQEPLEENNTEVVSDTEEIRREEKAGIFKRCFEASKYFWLKVITGLWIGGSIISPAATSFTNHLYLNYKINGEKEKAFAISTAFLALIGATSFALADTLIEKNFSVKNNSKIKDKSEDKKLAPWKTMLLGTLSTIATAVALIVAKKSYTKLMMDFLSKNFNYRYLEEK
jgi:hypothetical protein